MKQAVYEKNTGRNYSCFLPAYWLFFTISYMDLYSFLFYTITIKN